MCVMRAAGCERDQQIRYGGVAGWLGIQPQVPGSANIYGSGPGTVESGCWGSASEEPRKRKTQVGEVAWLVLVQLLALAALRLAGEKHQGQRRREERNEKSRNCAIDTYNHWLSGFRSPVY